MESSAPGQIDCRQPTIRFDGRSGDVSIRISPDKDGNYPDGVEEMVRSVVDYLPGNGGYPIIDPEEASYGDDPLLGYCPKLFAEEPPPPTKHQIRESVKVPPDGDEKGSEDGEVPHDPPPPSVPGYAPDEDDLSSDESDWYEEDPLGDLRETEGLPSDGAEGPDPSMESVADDDVSPSPEAPLWDFDEPDTSEDEAEATRWIRESLALEAEDDGPDSFDEKEEDERREEVRYDAIESIVDDVGLAFVDLEALFGRNAEGPPQILQYLKETHPRAARPVIDELNALEEIRREQTHSGPVINPDAFKDIAQDVLIDIVGPGVAFTSPDGVAFDGMKFDEGALKALQSVSEQYLVDLFAQANFAAINGGRTYVSIKDLQLVRRVRGERS